MNSTVLALVAVIAALVALRKRNPNPISRKQTAAIFVAVLLLHATVIGGLIAFNHWKQS